MQRIPPLASAVLLGATFAFGVIFDSVAGWTVAYETPRVSETCRFQTDTIACATLASAEATATIARWTRFDAILSVFSGLAALFAFLAFRESRRTADYAREELQVQQKQYDLERDRTIASLVCQNGSIQIFPVSGLFGPDPRQSSWRISFEIVNQGQSEAQAIAADLEIELSNEERSFHRGQSMALEYGHLGAGEKLPRQITFSEPAPSMQLLTSEADWRCRVYISIQWRDITGQRKVREFEGFVFYSGEPNKLDLSLGPRGL